jgi:titin
MWKKPDNDGGNPISGYIIEAKQPNSSEWIQCNNYPTKLPEYTASNVQEGLTYEFRIKAVNDAGVGAPSRPSKPQKAEPPISN